MFDALDDPHRNLIADIKDNLFQFSRSALFSFTDLLSGTDMKAIDDLANAGKYDERIQFLHNKLQELELKYNVPEFACYKNIFQKQYCEDAKPTLDWFVMGVDSPECAVPVIDFFDI